MTGWHVIHEDDALTVSRGPSPRWDVAVEAEMPAVASRRRLAHQIRQDMWRRLQNLRGFSPAVRVMHRAGGCDVRAGGAVSGRYPKAATEAAIADLLTCPRNRGRWVACAGKGRHA